MVKKYITNDDAGPVDIGLFMFQERVLVEVGSSVTLSLM